MTKRKLESTTDSDQGEPTKRARTDAATLDEGQEEAQPLEKKKRQVQPRVERNNLKATHKVRKLDPPRPFPTVPASVSATGPRSAHTEGKNYICVTRRTELAAYLRRCKDVILKDGYVVVSKSSICAHCPRALPDTKRFI